MPLSTHLAARVQAILADPDHWAVLPESVQEWLQMQRIKSELPSATGLLVETFPRGGKWFLVAYCFEGKLAHQTLGMLATRRMERLGWGPLGFVATDYILACWSAFEPDDPSALFVEDLLGEDLEDWIAESSMLRRTFRNIATIAGLLEKHHPGVEKSRKQMSVNSDLIYDVLRKHEPDHVLLRATRAEAAFGLTDIRRIGTLLARVKGQIRHRRLDKVSPLAVPALIEVGREWVAGGAEDALLAEAAALIEEATGEPASFLEIQPAGLEEFASQGDRDRPIPTRRPPRTARNRRRG
jgi:ATP-dependent Lhr-like helicase